MPTSTELIVICSEIFLALHPILLKTIDVPLLTQLVLRLGTYTALGGAFAQTADWNQTWGSFDAIKISMLSGIMNLIHIGSSYTSYKHLSAGSSLALFYTYPFMNILMGVLVLGETVSLWVMPLLLIAFVGVLLISYSENEREVTNEDKDDSKNRKNTNYGIAMALLAAFTESLIFLIAKTSARKNPFVNIIQLYPFGFLILAVYSGYTNFKNITADPTQIMQIIGFNVFIGFIGYSLRFYSIPRLTTVVFSILTFVGVAAGYGWGLIFANEKPSVLALTGAACITGSVGLMELYKLQ